jgi:hypothetical protein
MAVQNYGAIMQGAADLTAMPANAFAQGQQRRQAHEYRNALLAQDQQAQAFQQQRYQDEQAQGQQTQASVLDLIDQAEAAFEQGGFEAVRPIVGQLAAYDPRIAEQIAKSYEEDEKVGTLYQTAEGFLPAEQAVGKMPYRAPEKPQKPGYGAPQQGVNPRSGKPDQYILDDYGQPKWLGIAPVEQGPKPLDIAKTRKEFRSLPSVKDYETVLPLLVSARKAPDNGYGDLQLIYTAGKVLDPGSVVREGELALTVAAGSPLQRIIGKTRFTTEQGGRLTPETRKQILEMLNERALALRQGYDRDYQQYAEYATAGGMVPRDVVGRHAANAYQPQKKEAPASAVEHLRKNPNLKAAFKAKYGYLPDGL